MRVIRFADSPFLPAGHENPASPGVLRKVLLGKADLRPGRMQMINWASLGVGKRFAPHYHEDMQEVFVVMQGTAEITIAGETTVLRLGEHRGDRPPHSIRCGTWAPRQWNIWPSASPTKPVAAPW